MTSFLVPPCALAQEGKTLPLPSEGPRLPVPSIYTVVIMNPKLTTSSPCLGLALDLPNLFSLCAPLVTALAQVCSEPLLRKPVSGVSLPGCSSGQVAFRGGREEEDA